MRSSARLEIYDTPDLLAAGIAEWLIVRVAAAEGLTRIALSGGTTPKTLFSLLARPEYSERVAWSRLVLYWGDERFVPYDSADSNYGAARALLLSKVPIPAGNVHPMPVDGTPEAAAAQYAAILRDHYGAASLDAAYPLFDIVFLGLGEDGHTASLIPGQPVLQERGAWVAAVGQGRPEVRLTLTYPALESARTVAFMVAGAGKARILGDILAGTADVPAAHLHPTGETIWFVDRAARPGA